jgi:miniconductance mechanosensitive channel
MQNTLLIILEGTKYLVKKGVNETISLELMFTILIVSLILTCFILDFVTKLILNKIVKPIIEKTEVTWDDILLEKNVFKGVAHIVPIIALKILIPILFLEFPNWVDYGLKFTNIYFAFAIIYIVISISKSIEHFFATHPIYKDKPIESYMQVIRLIAYLIGIVYIISVIINQSPLGIFSALGAMSVVLMLVFKDTILGFVASIQMAANDMIRLGDWVEFPKYGADGDVIEIKLQTVKIRNFDKTITTVPTYAFVSDAFKNWRGMQESGGRRIKRSIVIDMHSIKFCDEEMLNRFKKIKYIEDYISKKIEELNIHNANLDADLSTLANKRRLTNIGTFRAYIDAYLKHNDKINQDMSFLVRQLQSDDKGIPLEIYVFVKDLKWANYENIQADIFDHLLAIVNEFDLDVYQSPSGIELTKAIKELKK